MTVAANFRMSLAGFVARPGNSAGPPFDRPAAGDAEVPMGGRAADGAMAVADRGRIGAVA